MPENNANDQGKSPHILNASSNLVGFSFLLLTAVKTFGLQRATLIDDVAAVEVLLFSVSSLLSFMSMRATSAHQSYFYENIADIIFFIGLSILSLGAILVVFTVIK
jgi:hypothetical protein